jgi:Mn-dependent DtxR family transcriptional regulator
MTTDGNPVADGGDDLTAADREELTVAEQELLATLAANDGELEPAGLALALDRDLGDVYEAIARLHEAGLLERTGFDVCRLTDRGRHLLDTGRTSA